MDFVPGIPPVIVLGGIIRRGCVPQVFCKEAIREDQLVLGGPAAACHVSMAPAPRMRPKLGISIVADEDKPAFAVDAARRRCKEFRLMPIFPGCVDDRR